jgi:hypothetical protein
MFKEGMGGTRQIPHRQTKWKENTVAVNRPAFPKLPGVI